MNSLSAESYSKQGHHALRTRDYEGAAMLFRKALDLDRERSRQRPDMRNLSYYGLSLAKAGLSEKIATEACRTALSKQRRDPVLYINLGRVHIAAGRTATAIKTIEKGLEVAPAHPTLLKEFESLNRRRRPVIPFLSRDNLVNRWLGRLRARRHGV